MCDLHNLAISFPWRWYLLQLSANWRLNEPEYPHCGQTRPLDQMMYFYTLRCKWFKKIATQCLCRHGYWLRGMDAVVLGPLVRWKYERTDLMVGGGSWVGGSASALTFILRTLIVSLKEKHVCVSGYSRATVQLILGDADRTQECLAAPATPPGSPRLPRPSSFSTLASISSASYLYARHQH